MLFSQTNLETAWGLHQKGQLNEAEQAYRQLQQEAPHDPDLFHLLGMIAQQKGDSSQALSLIRKAIAVKGGKANYHNTLGIVYESLGQKEQALSSFLSAAGLSANYLPALENAFRVAPDQFEICFQLGIAYHAQNRLKEAADTYIKALRLRSNVPEVYNNLGIVLHRLGKPDDAIAIYEQLINEYPDYAEAFNNLGVALQDTGRLEEAAQAYRTALRIDPDYPEAHYNQGRIHYLRKDLKKAAGCFLQAVALKPAYAMAQFELGNCLEKIGDRDRALFAYQQALAVQPDLTVAHFNMALVLKQQKKIKEAIGSLSKFLQAMPDHLEANNEMGVLLHGTGDYPAALEQYKITANLDPTYAPVQYNLGCLYQDMEQWGSAYRHFQQAIALQPDHIEAHVNSALLLLHQGDYRKGFQEYEWRTRRDDWQNTYPVYDSIPFWDGSDLSGRTILVRTEQGLGDTLQLVRFLHRLKQADATVILETRKGLRPLLKGLPDIDRMVTETDEISACSADFQVFLASLPLYLGITLADLPGPVPYLFSNPVKQKQWEKCFSEDTPKIGIAWAGNPDNPDDAFRSCPLDIFQPLLSLPGIQWISLQKGMAEKQAHTDIWKERLLLTGDQLHDFSDTAALIDALDLVITVDTVIVHLAAALGKQVWLLRPAKPYWVWMDKRSDSPWYPTVTIFRQKELGNWEPVIESIEKLLLEETGS